MAEDKEFNTDNWSIASRLTEQYVDACSRAIADPKVFKVFRSLPEICAITENKSDKSAYDRWREFCNACSDLIAESQSLQRNDKDGSPRLIPVAELGVSLSTSTMKYAGDYATLRSYFGCLDGLRIAEIGGGYGNFAAVIHHFSNVKSYTIYDIPEVVTLQKKYLDSLGLPDVQFKSSLGTDEEPYDLVLSCCAFSELTEELQYNYIQKVFKSATMGWIVYSLPHAPNSHADWSSSAVYDWLRKEMAPIPVQWAWKVSEYTKLYSGLEWTYIWGNGRCK